MCICMCRIQTQALPASESQHERGEDKEQPIFVGC